MQDSGKVLVLKNSLDICMESMDIEKDLCCDTLSNALSEAEKLLKFAMLTNK